MMNVFETRNGVTYPVNKKNPEVKESRNETRERTAANKQEAKLSLG